VGHLPYGFFEKEMLKYFTQFGKVVNVRVARSSRTAKSKGYGWVQFKSLDVAAIACKTMHGYMLFRKKLDCKILTPQQVTAGKLFRNSRRRMLPSRRPAIHKAEVNEEVTKQRRDKMVKRNVVKRGRLQKELEQLGIEYELPPVEAPRKSAQGSKPRVLKKHKKAKATE
jgi:nucleolar protein 15